MGRKQQRRRAGQFLEILFGLRRGAGCDDAVVDRESVGAVFVFLLQNVQIIVSRMGALGQRREQIHFLFRMVHAFGVGVDVLGHRTQQRKVWFDMAAANFAHQMFHRMQQG